MARVQLYLRPPGGNPVFRFLRPDGSRDALPALRLYTYPDLSALVRPGLDAPHAAFPAGVLDTGALLSTLPESIWSQFRPGAVTPLPFDPTMPASRRRVSIAGGNWPYDLAELSFRLRDLAGGVMHLSVVAQRTHDGGQLTVPLVLGLRGGTLDGRALRAEPDPSAPHGQRWTLEDP